MKTWRTVLCIVVALLTLSGCVSKGSNSGPLIFDYVGPGITDQEFQMKFPRDKGQCLREAAMLPSSPMPPAPVPYQPPSPLYPQTGGVIPSPGFSEGFAAQDYEIAMSRARAADQGRRNDYFTGCMLEKGWVERGNR